MKWNLKKVDKITNEKYLNYYKMHYEVIKDGKVKSCDYCLSSRNPSIDTLRASTHEFSHPDAVMVACYLKKGNVYYYLLETQFRQPINRETISFPAGLCDKEDSSPLETAKREVREETGYEIDNLYLLTPPSPTSEGMSDECNSVVVAQLVSKGKDHKEEFEDITCKLYSEDEVRSLLNDKNIMVSNSTRLTLLYLLASLK